MQNNSKNLLKSLNLFDATAIVAGSMIGSGIFIVSADISRQVNSPWLLLLVWLIAGIMTISGALCYGEYAASIPEAGGQYVYLKKIWGNLVGFLYGWTLFLVIQTGTIAAVSVAFAKFAGILFPSISSSSLLLNTALIKLSTQQIVAIALTILLTWVNTKGVKSGIIVQNIFTSAKITALLAIVLIGLFLGLNIETVSQNFSVAFTSGSSGINIFSLVAVSLVGALFSADAWNNVTFIASEIKNPQRNMPLALILGTGGVILLYLLTNFAYLSVLSFKEIQHPAEDIIAAALTGKILGSSGLIIISVIILISALGCVNGMILAGARVFYAMAKDGLFFKSLSNIDEKTNVPTNALVLQGAWASILVLSGSYSQLLDYVIFAALIFYILTISGLFVFRKKHPDIERPYKTLGYPFLPAIYCILAVYVAFNLLIYKPDYTWPGLMIVLSGIPVYFVWNFINSRKGVEESESETILE